MERSLANRWLACFLIFHVIVLLSSIAVLTLTSTISLIYLFVIWLKSKRSPEDDRILISGAWPIFAIYLGATFISAALNWDDIKFRDSLIELRWILGFVAFTVIFRKIVIREKYFKIIYILLLIIGVYSVHQAITGFDFMRGLNKYPMGPYYRATAFFSNPIRFSNVLLVYFSFILSLLFFDFKNKRWDILKYLAFLGTTLALIAANARGAWIAIPVVVFLVASFYSKKLLYASLLVVTLLTSGLYVGSPYFKDRVDSIFEMDHPQTSPRKIIWQVYTGIWTDNIWFGVGAGNSGKVALERATEDEKKAVHALGTHAHNQLLNVLSEQGIFAGLALIAVFLYFMLIAFRAIKILPTNHFYRVLCIGALGALVSLIITGVTESNLVLNEVTNNFVLVLAIIQVSYWVARKKVNLNHELPS